MAQGVHDEDPEREHDDEQQPRKDSVRAQWSTCADPPKAPGAAQPSRIASLASMFFASSATWASATTS
ncbi:hypothetical protein GCM10009578_019230 [Streptomyces rhizosphaericus]